MARPRRFVRQIGSALAAFVHTEASGGFVLFGASVVALVWANLLPGYEGAWHTTLTFGALGTDLRHVINEGFMAVFFLVVGLEIKRELVAGELRDIRVSALPVLTAIGGMVVPAAVFLAFNAGATTARGWAIPMATDIAFVLGVLALLGPRVSGGLKAFMLALAIIDDIGAIVVIAFAFTQRTDVVWLAAAAAIVLLTFLVTRLSAHPFVVVLCGVALWCAMARAGVQPTLAGVIVGLLTPIRAVDRVQELMHPVSSFVAVPAFGLANAGVVLDPALLGRVAASRLFWGVVAGLVVGKVVGIAAVGAVSFRSRLRLPDGVGGRELVGGGFLGGIGFTVALFIATLSFDSPGLVAEAKLGVFCASVVAGALGTLVLRARPRA
jgi:Na+:H+ antiporter, NhaA family